MSKLVKDVSLDSLKKIEEQVTCSVCLDTFNDPKSLQCLHIFCRPCLQHIAKLELAAIPRHQLGEVQASIACPTCRKRTPIPAEGGVAKLETAFHINQLFEIRDSLKIMRQESINSTSSMESEGEGLRRQSSVLEESQVASSLESVGKKAAAATEIKFVECAKHPGKELQMYCEECREMICYECTIRTHNGHAYDLLGVMAEKRRQELLPRMEPVEAKVAEVEQTLAQVRARQQEVRDRADFIESNIEDLAQRLHQAIDVRKAELVERLEAVSRGKLKALAAEQDMKESNHAQLSACVALVKEAIFRKSDLEFLEVKAGLEKRLQEIHGMHLDEPDVCDVMTQADMLLSVPPDLVQSLHRFGQVLGSATSLDPYKCTAKGEGLEMASRGERAVVHLTAVNYKGLPCEDVIKSLDCSLFCEENGSAVKCNTEQVNQSLYKISYTPMAKGRHQLRVKVEGQHIGGSPFTVTVNRALNTMGMPTFVIDGLQAPWAVCQNKKGEMIVTEFNRSQINVFSPSGERLRSFCSLGSREGFLNQPRGVALDKDDNIFVADSKNYRVQKFSQDGTFLGSSGGRKGSGPKEFVELHGMSFNAINNKLYVADAHRVQTLNTNLTFSGTIGKFGSGKGEFRCCFSVACDSIGYVYVSDLSNSNIQIFTLNGQFLRMFASQVSHSPRLFGKALWGSVGVSDPSGLAIDPSGMVYVSENAGMRVSVFTPQGYCKTSFGREGAGRGEFKWPRGIAVTSGGDVWVCEFKNNRIQVF